MPNENRNIWFKLKKEMPLDQRQQQEFLAYAVDYDLLVMSVISHYQNEYDQPPAGRQFRSCHVVSSIF